MIFLSRKFETQIVLIQVCFILGDRILDRSIVINFVNLPGKYPYDETRDEVQTRLYAKTTPNQTLKSLKYLIFHHFVEIQYFYDIVIDVPRGA